MLSKTIISLALSFLTFGTSVAEAIIVVKNDYNPAEIKQLAAYYARVLNLDTNVYILVNFSHRVSRELGGHIRYQDARAEGGGHQIHITINRKAGRASQMHTLAHEMVHAQQFIEGRLVQCGSAHYRWKDQPCKKVANMAYLDRPWEKEAVEVGKQLYNQFREKPKKEFVSLWNS